MKRIFTIVLLALCVLLLASGEVWAGKIYRNNTKNPTAADSIVITCPLTNSSVVAQRIATNDYFLVTVKYPNGDSAWTSKIDSSDARVREVVRTSGTITNYNYELAFQVSDVDGDGREGVYAWEVTAVDSSGPSHSIYTGSMPVYSLNFYRMMDSVTSYLTEEYTNIIASDRGKVLVPTERTDGAYPTTAGRWKIRTGAGFGSGDSVNTNSKLDSDLDGDVDGSDATARLIIDGDSTVCIWVGANSVTHDTTTARCLIDTTTIDPRFFSNITFWAYVDMDHPHEGFCPGNAYSNSATDGDTPLKFIRVLLSSDTALATYYYKDFGDTAVVRGWNKFVIAKSDFSKVGSIVWPVSDSSKPLLTVGFMVSTDSVAGSSGMRDIRLMVDDIRINKRARPKFMFRLDDGSRSQVTHAYPVFQDFPFRPTSNVCGYTIQLGAASGGLDTTDLRVLYEDGWDLANHAWYSSENEIPGSPGIDSLAMAGTSLMNDRFIVNRNQSYILDLGFKRGAGFFAWPLDAYDSTAIRVMAERHNFATGGKLGGYADHADEIPEKATGYRYTYPYNPWTSNTPEIDIDTVKAWIAHAIERGIPLILGAHSFKGHHSYVVPMTVGHEGGASSPQGVPAVTYVGTNQPTFVTDGETPDDADYLYYDGNAGAQANSYVVCSLNTSSSWYVTKNSDNNWIDTVTIQWRIRGSATTTNDTLFLVVDTASTETIVNVDTIIGLPIGWTTYSVAIRKKSEGIITGNDFNAGIKLKNTLGSANDTILWSWLHVRAGDDSGTTSGYGTQMDSSYLRAICNELVAKQGLIDAVTLSEYFRTQGSGGRLTQIAKNTQESRDSTISMTATIAGLEDTILLLQDSINALMTIARNARDSATSALDSLQSQDNWVAKASELTKVIDSVNAVLDTLQLHDGWVAKASELTKVIDSVNGILDTLQLYDGRWALASALQNNIDTTNAILDTLQLYDTRLALQASLLASIDTVNAILDSLQLYDGRWALQSSLLIAIDSINASLDTLQLHDNWVAKTSQLEDSAQAALINLGLTWLVDPLSYNPVADGSNSTTRFRVTGLGGPSVDDTYKGKIIHFTGGTNSGVTRVVVSSTFITGSAHYLDFDPSDPWPNGTPVSSDAFRVFHIVSVSPEAVNRQVDIALGDSLDIVKDSLQAVLDSIQLHDDWVAKQASLLIVRDTVNGIIDTLQNHDDWVAKASELVKVIDSINAVLDTLQNQDNWVAQQSVLAAVRDTANAILDTLQLYDGWIAQQATLTAVRDTANAIIDTVQNQDNWIATQAVLTATRDTANAILDTLQNSSSTLRTSGSLTAITDTVNAIIDTLQNHDNWVAKEATLTTMTTTLGAVRDTVNAIMDSLQLHDNWVAKEATLTTLTTTIGNIRDTVNASIDTLQNQDDWGALQSTLINVRDTVNAIIDTTQSQDGWIAQNSVLTAVRDTTNAILDTLQLYDGRWALASELTKAIDTANASLDTLQNQDNWIAQQSTLTATQTTVGAVRDTANAIMDTLQNASSTLRSSGSLTALTDTVNAILDTLQLYDTRLAVAAELQKAVDSINAALDTLQLQDNWGAKEATLTSMNTVLGAVRDTANAILDTLQLQDNWAAKAAELTKVIDTANATLDTLQNASSTLRSSGSLTALTDSVQAILDTLQLYDGRWALSVDMIRSIDTTNAILDTLQLYDGRLALATDLQKAIDSVNAILDTLQLYDGAGWLATRLTDIRDTANATLDTLQNASSTLRGGGSLTALTDSVNAILDTLQLYDGRWALQSSLQSAIDSINAVLDTLQLYDGRLALQVDLLRNVDTTNAILDTLQLYDTRLSTAAELQKALDSINAVLDTLQLYDGSGWLFTRLTQARDTAFAVLDTLQNGSSTLRSTSSVDYGRVADSVRDALGDSLLAIRDSLYATLDTLQSQDNWVAKASELQKAIDSTNAVLDTLQLHDDWVARQATLTTTQATVGQVRDTTNAILDTLQNASSTLRSTGNLTALTDTVNAILDTLQLYDTRLAVAAELQKAVDSINAALDSLQLHDNWVGKEATLTSMNTILGAVRDTANAVLDTLQNQDNWAALQATLLAVRDTVNAIIDTAQNQDNWIAKASELQKAIDSTNAIIDTLQNGSSTLRSAGGAGADTLAIKVMMRVLLHDSLDIIHDSLFAVLDSLQNASSTLRSTAGIDYDALGDTLRAALGDTVPAYAGAQSLAGSNKNVVIFVIDTSGTDDTLAGAIVSVKNSSQTSNLVGWITQGSPPKFAAGLMQSTTYVGVPFLQGYAFIGPFPFTTTAGAAPDTVTLKGFDFDPGTPASPSMCRVFGWVKGPDGLPVDSAEVNLRLKLNDESNTVVFDTSTGLQVGDLGTKIYTDTAGYWELDRIANVLLWPPNLKYEYSVFKQSVINRTKKNVTVPNEASKHIEDLIH